MEGRTTRNIAPRGFDAANEILPPCRSRIVWQMAKPNPVPCDLVVVKGSKILPALASSIPGPVSSTSKRTALSGCPFVLSEGY